MVLKTSNFVPQPILCHWSLSIPPKTSENISGMKCFNAEKLYEKIGGRCCIAFIESCWKPKSTTKSEISNKELKLWLKALKSRQEFFSFLKIMTNLGLQNIYEDTGDQMKNRTIVRIFDFPYNFEDHFRRYLWLFKADGLYGQSVGRNEISHLNFTVSKIFQIGKYQNTRT